MSTAWDVPRGGVGGGRRRHAERSDRPETLPGPHRRVVRVCLDSARARFGNAVVPSCDPLARSGAGRRARAVQVLAGFVQGTVYAGVAVAAVFLRRALDAPSGGRRLWIPLLQPVVLLALVGALAAFQLLPTFHLLVDAGRATGLDYASASEDLIVPGDLVTAVLPNAYGMASALGHSSPFITLGLLAFVPLAWSRAGGRLHAGFLLLMAAVALGLAMAHTVPLYRLHYALLPQFRAPTRLLFLLDHRCRRPG